MRSRTPKYTMVSGDSKTSNHQQQDLTMLFVVAVKKFASAHIFGKRSNKPEVC